MKKNHKKTLFTRIVTFTLALAMALSSCLISGNSADAKKKVKVTKVKINTGKLLVLKKGQKKKLSVTVSPKKAKNKKVTYKSSNKKVAKVSKKGVVKAVGKKGTAKITVRSKSNKKKKATIKVKIGKPIKSIMMTGTKTRQEFYYSKVTNTDKTSANYGKVSYVRNSRWVNKGTVFSKKKSASITMELGMDKVSLKAAFSPKKPTYKKLSYTSSKPTVASVVAGTIVTRKAGTTTITVKAKDGSGKKAKIKVTVKPMGNYNTPAPSVKNISADDLQMIENFEGQTVGKKWDKYTAAGRDVAKDGDVMEVVKDPENASNKCLKVTPQGYDFAPVLSFDLPKGKTLDNYSGIYLKVRVVAGATADFTYKGVNAYFAPKGTLDYHYAFMTNEESQNNAAADAKKYFNFWAEKTMAVGDSDLQDSKGGTLSQMPTETNKGESEGFKHYEDDPKVGFATRSLEFTKYLTADLKKLSSLDLVVGSSYKKPNTTSDDDKVTWYIDDIALIKKPETQVKVTKIDVAGQDTVTIGKTAEYSATVTPANATEKGVDWSVSDTTKATIDKETGVLTAVSEGTINVVATAKDGSKVSGKKTVTIQKAAAVTGDYTVDVSKVAETVDSSKSGIASLTKDGDDYVSPAIGNDAKYFIDLGDTMDLSGYTAMRVVFKSKGGLQFALWADDFDITAEKWWDNNKVATYSSDNGTASDHDDGSEYKTQDMKLTGDVSKIRYVSVGTNKGFDGGADSTFAIKSITFLAPVAGAKDMLDDYTITYPVDENFTDAATAKLGWSNWDAEGKNYLALSSKDAGVTFTAAAGSEAAYATVPASEWNGIALPLDNRTGEAEKDFYVEATVKATGDELGKVGFSGSNTVADSKFYPGNLMKEYGSDYYLQRNVDSEWQTIKAKITVPAKKFGETRLKGTKTSGFLVKSVKIEEFSAQDLTMTEEPKPADEAISGTYAVDITKLNGQGNGGTYNADTKIMTMTNGELGLDLPKEVAAGQTVVVTLTGTNKADDAQTVSAFLSTADAGANGNVVTADKTVAKDATETLSFTLTPATATSTILIKGPEGGKLVNFEVSSVTLEF